MNTYTKKVKTFLTENRKLVFKSSWKSLSKHLGISHQHIYTRLRKHNWTKSEIYALGKLFEINLCDKNQKITEKAIEFIDSEKKRRNDSVWTRKKMAKHLKMSISLLYQRFDNGNWKEDEKVKIKKL